MHSRLGNRQPSQLSWTNTSRKALTPYTDDMIVDLSEIYQRHMTRKDVDACLAFYSSDAGQRMVGLQPAIVKEWSLWPYGTLLQPKGDNRR